MLVFNALKRQGKVLLLACLFFSFVQAKETSFRFEDFFTETGKGEITFEKFSILGHGTKDAAGSFCLVLHPFVDGSFSGSVVAKFSEKGEKAWALPMPGLRLNNALAWGEDGMLWAHGRPLVCGTGEPSRFYRINPSEGRVEEEIMSSVCGVDTFYVKKGVVHAVGSACWSKEKEPNYKVFIFPMGREIAAKSWPHDDHGLEQYPSDASPEEDLLYAAYFSDYQIHVFDDAGKEKLAFGDERNLSSIDGENKKDSGHSKAHGMPRPAGMYGVYALPRAVAVSWFPGKGETLLDLWTKDGRKIAERLRVPGQPFFRSGNVIYCGRSTNNGTAWEWQAWRLRENFPDAAPVGKKEKTERRRKPN